MSDLFHEDVPDEFIDQIVAVAVLTQQHIYQALTKRADRMIKYWTTPDREAWIAKAVLDLLGPKHAVGLKLPLPNWWQGVSVEDQVTADSRIPLLLQTPAATRFVSYEPALGPVDFRWGGMSMPDYAPHRPLPQLDWVIVGGESGHNARAFDIEWARATITQCKKAGVACFVKQLGARPYVADPSLKINTPFRYMPKYADDETGQAWVQLCDRPGTDPSEWPEDLRVQEFPL